MLQELMIKNFAIIHNLSLHFQEGMSVLTGETGAGKSIIIDAVGLLAGGRGSSEFVRHGEKKCVLEGMFTLENNEDAHQILEEYGIDQEDQTLIVQREIYASGRTVCRVNGRLVTIAALRDICSHLVDIHGQNEHQELMRPERHLSLLDTFGAKELQEQYQIYTESYQQYKKVKKEYDEWQHNEQELAQRIDILQFQTDEIEAAKLEVGEEERLSEEKNRLVNYQRVMQSLSAAYAALQGNEENNGLDAVGQAMEAMGSIEDLDSQYKRLSEMITNTYFQLQEAASDLFDQLDELAYDENRLNEIEERLDVIHQLKRKYGASIEDILKFQSQASEELERIQDREGQINKLSSQLEELAQRMVEKGRVLSDIRREKAELLENEIHEQLKELYMDKVIFDVRFKKEANELTIEDAGSSGLDKVEFYVSTNPGEPLNPLAKVASGGELSRMMLAMKTVFSKNQGITSIIFDEVDTGVSGRVAQAIAEKIHSIAAHSQVLCITHLPQVAATADNHFYISKKVEDERTTTSVSILEEEEKVEEVARMLAGTEITPLTIETAKELRKIAHKQK
ncbi:DNA repair protein RecN [Atopococcus tabaci]|uniref:DNA repair protein RecN n=1 Tax=Atopococcus tabaci TaxID=269774 RepID=UPI002409C2EA|nr:DNA repair protein RecN [Atopococcus tabaci]